MNHFERGGRGRDASFLSGRSGPGGEEENCPDVLAFTIRTIEKGEKKEIIAPSIQPF